MQNKLVKNGFQEKYMLQNKTYKKKYCIFIKILYYKKKYLHTNWYNEKYYKWKQTIYIIKTSL